MSRFSQQHKQSKYKVLYQRVARAIQDGRFYRYTKQKQQALYQRLQRYEQQLKHYGIAAASVTALFVAPIAATAQTAVGSEFIVNSYTTNRQFSSSVAMDSNGDFVVIWMSFGQDGNRYGIYGQRYNSSGVAQGSEFQVNTFTTNQQRFPSVAMDSDGDFVVTWASLGQDGDRYGIYGQRYNNSGVAQGSEFKVNTYTTGSQRNPSVAMDSDGDFVVTWASSGQDGSGYGIYGQRYNSSGVAQGSEFKVNTYTTNGQFESSVAMDSDGDFVVTWESYSQDGNFYGVYGQRYNSSGVAQGSEFQVNAYTTDFQAKASVAMDSDGDFVVTWASSGQDGSNNGIYGQRYNNSGVAQGSEFQVNAYTTGSQRNPSVAMDSDGDFVVIWQSSYQDRSNYGIYAQSYSKNGLAQGSEFKVNTYTTSYQGNASVAMDSDGDFVVTWESSYQDSSNDGIYGQRYQNSCAAAAGLIANSASASSINLCQGTDDGLTFSASAASTSDEYAFLLVDGSGNILQNTADGDFDLSTLSVGTYTVYGLSYASKNNPAAVADYLADKTTITAIQADDADSNFCLELSNTATEGETNLLTVKPNPVITQQPSDQAICADETATFEVTASGSDLEYQWQQNGEDLDGQLNASLSASEEGEYNVLITQNGCTISSDTVSLTIKPNPVITQQPSDQAICADETATFEVTASGSDLEYQWQQNGEDLDGQLNASLSASEEGEYNVLITQNGCTISSDTISLTLDPGCDIPDISTLEVSYCEKELSADFEPVAGAVGYRAEITVLGRNGEVITRNIPTPPFDLKIAVPERLLGTTIQVRLAAIFIDAETGKKVVGTFSESRNIVIVNCSTRNSNDLESRGAIETALTHALLSPNPASEILNLSYASLSASQVEIMVMDGTGRMVWQTKQTSSVGANQLEIPIADLPAGVYQLRLVIAEEVAVLPFVKQ